MKRIEYQQTIVKNCIVLITYYISLLIIKLIFDSINTFEYIIGTIVIINLSGALIGAIKRKHILTLSYIIIDLIYIMTFTIVLIINIALDFRECYYNDICTTHSNESLDKIVIVISVSYVLLGIYAYYLHIETIVMSINMTCKKKKLIHKEQKIEDGLDYFGKDNVPLICMKPISDTYEYYPQIYDQRTHKMPPSFNPAISQIK